MSGIGIKRVNHHAEFCVFQLNQKIPLYHQLKVLREHENLSAAQMFLIYDPNTEHSTPVTCSAWTAFNNSGSNIAKSNSI